MSVLERVLPTTRHVLAPYVGGQEWSLGQLMDIEDTAHPGRVYLRRRIIVKTPWFAIYLHRILEPDSDRWLHNHPFAFWSVVLSGAYTEERAAEPTWRNRKRWSVARTRLTDFHRITGVRSQVRGTRDGVVTLVLCGPRRQEWGFITPAGFKTWQQVEF